VLCVTTGIPTLVGGEDGDFGAVAELLHLRGGCARVGQLSLACVAECARLLETSYRAVNIALVNELKVVFRAMDVDIWEVVDPVAAKPFGYTLFSSVSGIVSRRAAFYLAWTAREIMVAKIIIPIDILDQVLALT
jgi:UDP-N-acetyl-D-glucosamine dehydrogenase